MNRLASILLVVPILIACTFLTTTQCQGQTITGYAGVTWGMKRAQAKKIFARQPGITYLGDNPEMSIFEGGVFEGYVTTDQTLLFLNDRFYSAYISIEGDTSVLRKKFDSLRTILLRKYGTPVLDYWNNTTWNLKRKGREEDIVDIVFIESGTVAISFTNGEALEGRRPR